MKSEQTAIRTTYFSVIGNTSLALIKGLAGFYGNSYALIADAIESTTDIFSSLLVLIGFKYAKRPADENHPYGHGKIEPLITFLVVAFLVTSATIIAYESIQNIQTPHKIPKPWTLIVLGAIILWKEISFRIVIKKSKETNSSSLKDCMRCSSTSAIRRSCSCATLSLGTLPSTTYSTNPIFPQSSRLSYFPLSA